jgi:hypothetical protein
MPGVVAAAMGEVDAAGESHVLVGVGPVDHDQLLMVGAGTADTLVEQDLASGLVDHVPQVQVLAFAERLAQMGAPQQAPHLHAFAGQLGQDLADLGAWAVQALVRVAAPIGQQHQVAGAQGAERGQQPTVVGASMDQRVDQVTLSPGPAVRSAPVDRRGWVAALGGT